MSIMLEKYRARTQEFIKYIRDIRKAAEWSSNGWFIYDKTFHLRKASDPHSSLGTINSELWLMYVNNNAQAYIKSQMPVLNTSVQRKQNNNALKTLTSKQFWYMYTFNAGKQAL